MLNYKYEMVVTFLKTCAVYIGLNVKYEHVSVLMQLIMSKFRPCEDVHEGKGATCGPLLYEQSLIIIRPPYLIKCE